MKPRTALPRLMPLAACLAATPLALAQTPPAEGSDTVMPVVKTTARPEPQGRDGVQAATTRLGKGTQELRDLPQSITVVTEKLIDDRNLDTVKDVLKATAGITFLAAEGGEEDVRLRGFPLQATGDVFVDGMRDPAFYDRDTFFLDRVEVLRGSASMLFGRGSTGGAVNQVSKRPYLITQHQIDTTVGSHGHVRLVGDFNIRLGDSSAVRLGTMFTQAEDNGAGTPVDKRGVAAVYRWGIGLADEFSAGIHQLDNRNGMNYGMPWIRPTPTADASQTTLLPLDPATAYAMASDRNDGSARTLTLTHRHRFDRQHSLTTQVRTGAYTRDQRATTIRLATASAQPGGVAASLASFGPDTVLTRGTQLKVQDMDTLFAQSDYEGRFEAWGLTHGVQAGVDLAREKKTVCAARSAAQGGVNLAKPVTLVGTPSDGAWIDEDSRVLRAASAYRSAALGVYLQDLVQLAPAWKLLLGVRHDRLQGDYDASSIPTTAAGPETRTSYRMRVAETSHRAGLLFQPTPLMSFHLSGATSFNTSGDAYSLSAANAGIPPEQSINVELGGRLDSADGRMSARLGAFRSTKLHERNTDPLVNLVTLSGKRHAAGLDMDLAGRITPAWEAYLSYLWMPVAVIDAGVAGNEGVGTRPSLSPRHSGSVWTTVQLTPRLRVGGGLNARSSQTPIRNPGWSAPGWVTADLMGEWVVVPDQLTLKLNLSNITNRLYADALYTGHYVPGAGRLVQLTTSLRF